MRHHHEDLLASATASTLLPVEARHARRVLHEMVADLWHPRTVVEEPALLVHALADQPGGPPECWLSWTVEPVAGGATRVVLVHDELGSAAPAPELDRVLLQLLARCRAVQQA